MSGVATFLQKVYGKGALKNYCIGFVDVYVRKSHRPFCNLIKLQINPEKTQFISEGLLGTIAKSFGGDRCRPFHVFYRFKCLQVKSFLAEMRQRKICQYKPPYLTLS